MSSSSSERLSGSSRGSSSIEIHNNITRLKRDLNILKSQMVNLTSEVFDGKSKYSVHKRNTKEDKKSAPVPLKANVQISSPYAHGACSDTDVPHHHHLQCHVSDSDLLKHNRSPFSRISVSDLDNENCCRKIPSCVISKHSVEKRTNVEDEKDNIVSRQCSAKALKSCCCHEEISLKNENSDMQKSPVGKSSKKKRKVNAPCISSHSERKHHEIKNCQRKCCCSDDVENCDIDRLHEASGKPCSPLTERANGSVVSGMVNVPEVVVVQDQAEITDDLLRIPLSPHSRMEKRCHSPSPIIFIQNYRYVKIRHKCLDKQSLRYFCFYKNANLPINLAAFSGVNQGSVAELLRRRPVAKTLVHGVSCPPIVHYCLLYFVDFT